MAIMGSQPERQLSDQNAEKPPSERHIELSTRPGAALPDARVPLTVPFDPTTAVKCSPEEEPNAPRQLTLIVLHARAGILARCLC